MNLRKFLLILTIALVMILAITVWFSPSNEDFRTENPSWNGVKDISAICPTSPVKSLDDLPPSPQGTTLILIPYLNFTLDELEALNNFVTLGGTLILADDYGHGNQILAYLGLKARFSGQPLLDPSSNYRNQWFPRIPHLKPSPLTSNIERLVFNHATCLTGVETGDVVALSSSFSFLDLNGNQLWDETEPAGPLPVISQHNLGDGQVVLITDPSLFINSMQTMESNEDLLENIATLTPSELLIDQSHLPPSNLHQTKGLLASIRDSLSTPAGTLLLVILALTVTLMPLWHERRRN